MSNKNCLNCDGTGKRTCHICRGKKYSILKNMYTHIGGGVYIPKMIPCHNCDDEGNEKCINCGGTGKRK